LPIANLKGLDERSDWLDIPLGTEIAEDYQASLSTKASGDVFISGGTYAVPSMPCVRLRSSSGAFPSAFLFLPDALGQVRATRP
jgi:hypothetical protein